MTDIFKISGEKTNTSKLFQDLGLGDVLEKEKQRAIKDTAEKCVQSLQSKVPVRNQELRASFYMEEVGDSVFVRINNSLHESSATEQPLSNPELAVVLNRGISRYGTRFKRSQRSIRSGNYSIVPRTAPTADWIKDAQDEVHKGFK